MKKPFFGALVLILTLSASGNALATNMFATEVLAPADTSPPLEAIQEIFAPAGNFPSSKFWKVAVVQWNPKGAAPLAVAAAEVAAYLQSTHAQMEAQIRLAAQNGAKYITLSEFAAIGYPAIPNVPPEDDNYRTREDLSAYVETVPGPTTEHFGALAKELGVWIQYGMAEVDPVTQFYYDDAVVLNDAGQLVAKYRKENRYHIEENFLEPGRELATFVTPAGLFGLIVCSDIYYQPVLSGYRQQRLDVLSLSTSWAEQNTGMSYFRAAAQEVGSYLLAANQNYFPDSGVIEANGAYQSHIRQSLNSIAYGYLPLK